MNTKNNIKAQTRQIIDKHCREQTGRYYEILFNNKRFCMEWNSNSSGTIFERNSDHFIPLGNVEIRDDGAVIGHPCFGEIPFCYARNDDEIKLIPKLQAQDHANQGMIVYDLAGKYVQSNIEEF